MCFRSILPVGDYILHFDTLPLLLPRCERKVEQTFLSAFDEQEVDPKGLMRFLLVINMVP